MHGEREEKSLAKAEDIANIQKTSSPFMANQLAPTHYAYMTNAQQSGAKAARAAQTAQAAGMSLQEVKSALAKYPTPIGNDYIFEWFAVETGTTQFGLPVFDCGYYVPR